MLIYADRVAGSIAWLRRQLDARAADGAKQKFTRHVPAVTAI